MHCHIRVRGHLDASWRHRFTEWQITYEEGGISLLSGSLPDQAALHGVLGQIINLGLPLLSLETSEAPQQGEQGDEPGQGDARQSGSDRSPTGVPRSDREVSAQWARGCRIRAPPND
jgi:hypothetical protein